MLALTKPLIAFLDDDERILRSVQLLFQKTHEVFITTEPNTFVDFIRQHNVSVAICDQRMPKRTGVDVLREIKDLSPSTVRILLTGYADVNAIVDSINEGEIYRYIIKPFASEELIAIINHATRIAAENDRAMLANRTTSVMTQNNQNLTKKETLLVLDTDKSIFKAILTQFSDNYHIFYADNLKVACDYLTHHEVGVCLTDIQLDNENISPLLGELKQHNPQLVVIIQTYFQDAPLLINLINKGQIFRCLPKPLNTNLLKVTIERAFMHYRMQKQAALLSQSHETQQDPSPMPTPTSFSLKMKNLIRKLR